jgi:hypothetical protein
MTSRRVRKQTHKQRTKMKNITKAVLALAALGLSAWMITAQDASAPSNQGTLPAGQGGQGPEGHRPPPPPLIAALDANHDGVVDAAEIANASAALKTLDKNGDGNLTPDEFAPRPMGGPRGHHGPPPDGNGQQGQQQPGN